MISPDDRRKVTCTYLPLINIRFRKVTTVKHLTKIDLIALLVIGNNSIKHFQ